MQGRWYIRLLPSINHSFIHHWSIYNLPIKQKIDQTDPFIEQTEWCHKPNESSVSKFHYHMNIVPVITTIGLLQLTTLDNIFVAHWEIHSHSSLLPTMSRLSVCTQETAREQMNGSSWETAKPFQITFFTLQVTDTLHTFIFAFICEFPMELDLPSSPREQ